MRYLPAGGEDRCAPAHLWCLSACACDMYHTACGWVCQVKSCAGKRHRSPFDPRQKHTQPTLGERAAQSACIAREEAVGARALTSPGRLGCAIDAPAPPLLRLLQMKQSESGVSHAAHVCWRALLTPPCALPVRVLLTWCVQQQRRSWRSDDAPSSPWRGQCMRSSLLLARNACAVSCFLT